MTSFHRASAVTTAVIACLQAEGLLVGDAQKPSSGGWTGTPGQSTFNGYIVVYNLVGGTSDGSIAHPDEDAEPIYQLNAVGATRAQCEVLADNARAALLNGPVTVTNRAVTLVTVDMLGGATRDDDEQPPIWYSPDRYCIYTTPA